MFILKNKYFFLIETINDINLKKFKKLNKFNIIYRCKFIKDNKDKLKRFRQLCRLKQVNFYIANNLSLMKELKADGLYISAFNNKNYPDLINNKRYKIIGSAHNLKEFLIKKKQKCSEIFFSRIFKTNYKNKENFYGLIKFNLIINNYKYKFIPLGGINNKNYKSMRNVSSEGFALSEQIKKDNHFNKLLY